jgi:hypothetical protein
MNEWAVGDCFSMEREIHNRLSEYRVDQRREFFEAPLEDIISVIEEIILAQSLFVPQGSDKVIKK